MYKKYLEKINIDLMKKRVRHVHSESFLQEKPFKYILIGTGIAVLINFVFIFTHIKLGESSLPLKYNYIFGITRTGTWGDSLLLPILLLVISVINVLAAEYFYKKDKFLTYIFLSINFFFALLTFLEIVALNARGS